MKRKLLLSMICSRKIWIWVTMQYAWLKAEPEKWKIVNYCITASLALHQNIFLTWDWLLNKDERHRLRLILKKVCIYWNVFYDRGNRLDACWAAAAGNQHRSIRSDVGVQWRRGRTLDLSSLSTNHRKLVWVRGMGVQVVDKPENKCWWTKI